MTNIFETKEQYLAFRNKWAELAQAKKLTAADMMFYNIVRGKDLQHGFTPITRPSKFTGIGKFNNGAVNAYFHISHLWTSSDTNKKYFLSRFDGTITVEDINKITLEKVEPIYPDYGKGKLIAQKLREGATARNMDELMSLAIEEAA